MVIFWIGRFLLERGIAFIYFVAFLYAHNQFTALLGSEGLLPTSSYLKTVTFKTKPSLFHIIRIIF